MIVVIADETSLGRTCGALHDARFGLATMTFDADTGSWSGRFERECWERHDAIREERRFLWMRRRSCPVAECSLELNNVASNEVRDRSRIGTYTFNECRAAGDGIVVLEFCEDMEIRLRFSGAPEGTLRDLRTLDRRAYFPGGV